MNPNPANTQITDNNNQPINPTPQQPSEPEVVSNQNPLTPQLEKETPLDITIYPSNENPNVSEEPQKLNEINNTPELQPVTSITPNQELPPLPPLPTTTNTPLEVPTPSINQPIPNLVETPTINNNPVSAQENKLINPNSQKIAIIGGVLFGVLLVAGASVYYLTNMTKNSTTPESNINPITQKPTPVTPTPSPMPLPVAQNMTLGEYKLKTDSIFLKYTNTIKNNPINLSANVLSTETVKFVGDEIFALATEISELNVPTELSTFNTRLSQELNFQVQIFDNLLKSYKTTNTLSAEMKNKFTTDLKSSTDRLNLLINEIKNLK